MIKKDAVKYHTAWVEWRQHLVRGNYRHCHPSWPNDRENLEAETERIRTVPSLSLDRESRKRGSPTNVSCLSCCRLSLPPGFWRWSSTVNSCSSDTSAFSVLASSSLSCACWRSWTDSSSSLFFSSFQVRLLSEFNCIFFALISFKAKRGQKQLSFYIAVIVFVLNFMKETCSLKACY